MKRAALAFACVATLGSVAAAAQTINPNDPTWWDKYQILKNDSMDPAPGATTSFSVGSNVDVSNECGPQSEVYATVDTARPKLVAAGSNEIYRLPMRGYFSTDGGGSWGGVDLPLPPPNPGTNDTRFGSDPSLVFDTRGNLFYSYIVVFFGNGSGVNGSEMAVARSTDGGKTYPSAAFFGYQSGSNHFNDKPMITSDANPSSPYRDRVYVAWDAASGGSTGGGVRFAASTDHGASWVQTRIDDPSGPGRAIGAVPFVGPQGEVYAAWNDYAANAIVFNRSLDGGATWGAPVTAAPKSAAFQIDLPAESFRGALVYPACDADRSTGPNRGRLYCVFMDQTALGTADVFLVTSDDRGAHWSAPAAVAEELPAAVDRFDQWIAVDPTNGEVNVSFYDTRNDTTGLRYGYDDYLARSTDGGATFASARVSTATSNEHDCGGLYPCNAIDYGNQQGDYAGVAAYGGTAHPIWVDSREQTSPMPGCSRGLAMEEVFTAAVK